jgi:hypothetical protein
VRPPGRTVGVGVAAYSLVQYYSRICHLTNVRGLNIPHPRQGAHAGHDHWRNELMECAENNCRFAILEISKQYNGCGGVLRAPERRP